jgi:hypothetical protein
MSPTVAQEWLPLLTLNSSWSSIHWCKFCIHNKSSKIKSNEVKAIFSGMTSMLNFMKIYQLVLKLLLGTDSMVISQASLSKESRLETGVSQVAQSV